MKIGRLIAIVIALIAGFILAISYTTMSIVGICAAVLLYIIAYWCHKQSLGEAS